MNAVGVVQRMAVFGIVRTGGVDRCGNAVPDAGWSAVSAAVPVQDTLFEGRWRCSAEFIARSALDRGEDLLEPSGRLASGVSERS